MQYVRLFIEGTKFLKFKDKNFEKFFNQIGELSFANTTS